MTNREINEWRSAMIEAGEISLADIDELCSLETQYRQECDMIADACTEEGYPSNGSNYDLRCQSVREDYDEAINEILAKYEEEE